MFGLDGIIFGDKRSLGECCTFSKIRQYNVDDVIFDCDSCSKTTFFLLSGQCMILQCLKVPNYSQINRLKNCKVSGVHKNQINSKVLPQKCLNRANATKVPSAHVHFPEYKKYGKNCLKLYTLLKHIE
ncbi:hypothetical protein Bhyg_11458 [Pseudolycoriella hygida]|uniref:Uncharacterized protein n=1 Tax=Pseudolycoriella hygida TaxID=35572 RepID=A0A9Q0MVL2_9DIPT|nr:hypothetical protein Bhyg_11458 [Pseudolycoriella hygida]